MSDKNLPSDNDKSLDSDSFGLDSDDDMNELSNNAGESELEEEWANATQAGSDGQSAKTAPLPQFSSTDEGAFDEDNPNLDVVLDIPVTISMEVGSTEIPIRNLLQLNQGSVIELDRLAGEPLDVLVNGRLIAHGEVVMVNEKFGIRLTDVVSQQERVKKLT